MQSVKNEMTVGCIKQDSTYIVQLCSMYVNEWVCDFATTLDSCIDLCCKMQYKQQQMYDAVMVFAGYKISAEKVKALRKAVKMMSSASQE